MLGGKNQKMFSEALGFIKKIFLIFVAIFIFFIIVYSRTFSQFNFLNIYITEWVLFFSSIFIFFYLLVNKNWEIPYEKQVILFIAILLIELIKGIKLYPDKMFVLRESAIFYYAIFIIIINNFFDTFKKIDFLKYVFIFGGFINYLITREYGYFYMALTSILLFNEIILNYKLSKKINLKIILFLFFFVWSLYIQFFVFLVRASWVGFFIAFLVFFIDKKDLLLKILTLILSLVCLFLIIFSNLSIKIDKLSSQLDTLTEGIRIKEPVKLSINRKEANSISVTNSIKKEYFVEKPDVIVRSVKTGKIIDKLDIIIKSAEKKKSEKPVIIVRSLKLENIVKKTAVRSVETGNGVYKPTSIVSLVGMGKETENKNLIKISTGAVISNSTSMLASTQTATIEVSKIHKQKPILKNYKIVSGKVAKNKVVSSFVNEVKTIFLFKQQNDESSNNATWRLVCWQGYIEEGIKTPLLGNGFGRKFTVARLSELGWDNGHGNGWVDSHNSYIAIFFRAGIIGLAIFLWLIFSILLDGIKMLKKSNDEKIYFWLLSSICCVCYILVTTFFMPAINIPFMGIFLWIFLGIIVSIKLLDTKN